MNKFLIIAVSLCLGASPTMASVFPAITTMLAVGALPIADTGPGTETPQDPFAQAAKKTVYGRLSLAGDVTLEWDKRDYSLSSESIRTARQKKGQGIHQVDELLPSAGEGAWMVMRNKKTGSQHFIFSHLNDGQRTFPNIPVTDPVMVGGKFWAKLPGQGDGNYQLAQLVPDTKNPAPKLMEFKDGKLVGKVDIETPGELDLLLKQPGMSEAFKAMEGKWVGALKGVLGGKYPKLEISQTETGGVSMNFSVENEKEKKSYELTADKEGVNITGIGE